jgi:diaminopimelate decarboxylase
MTLDDRVGPSSTGSTASARDPESRNDIVTLFPAGTTLTDDRELVINGCRVSELADRFGTPALVIDEGELRRRVRRYSDGLRERWPRSTVAWASKSLPHTALFQVMAQEGVGVDVAGGGEMVMALAGGVDPSKMVVHGNAKTRAEILMALDAGVGHIVIDNFDDIDVLDELATMEQGVLIRVRPDVAATTHQALATGHERSKFGLSMKDARVAINRLLGSNTLRLDGLHVHVGSQITATDPFVAAVEALSELGSFDVYDLGGGLGARYTYGDQPPSIEEYLEAIIGAARRVLPSTAKLIIEPGRSIVADTAVTLYRVVTVKRGVVTFVAVDGGMGDNLEVSLYKQRFEATIGTRVGGGDPCVLVGRHCESGDQLIDEVILDAPQVGDVVAVPVTGAYCLTMANNYNGALRPPIIFVRDGNPRVVLRRETYDDLVRRDVV